jgi:hypothetical protein
VPLKNKKKIDSIHTLFLNPKYAPMKVSGTETPNQSARRAIRVVKGTAAELPLLQRIRFITKNKQNTTL